MLIVLWCNLSFFARCLVRVVCFIGQLAFCCVVVETYFFTSQGALRFLVCGKRTWVCLKNRHCHMPQITIFGEKCTNRHSQKHLPQIPPPPFRGVSGCGVWKEKPQSDEISTLLPLFHKTVKSGKITLVFSTRKILRAKYYTQ